MMMFWITAALASALAGLLVLSGARRGQTAVDDGPASDVARIELAALDRMRDDGVLSPDDWTLARAEAGRRLLGAATQEGGLRIGAHDRRWSLIAAVAATAAAVGLYVALGDMGLPDQSYASRVEAWATSTEPLEPAQVAAVLTREVALSPDDPRMLTMLGAARFQAGDSIGAASAFRRALTIHPDDAQSWARLGESLVRAQDGEVGVDAEAAFREALKRDPGQLGALYFMGEAALKRGDLNGVRVLWTPLINALDPADPRRQDLERRMLASGAAG